VKQKLEYPIFYILHLNAVLLINQYFLSIQFSVFEQNATVLDFTIIFNHPQGIQNILCLND